MANSEARRTAVLRFLRAGEAGGALIETAVTVPLLFILILGAVETAQVAYASIEVANAAKAAVAYGAQTGGTAGDTAGITYAATHDAANIPSLTVTSTSISYICSDGSASTGLSTDCANSHIEEILTVTTQATLSSVIHLPGLPTSYTLHGQASEKCLQ
jgi:Flp pilus assembly protein TadG